MSSLNSSFAISLDSSFDSVREFRNNNTANENNQIVDGFVDRIMRYFLKHNLTLVGLEDLMELLNEGREDCELLPTKKKQIMKLFRQHRDLVDIFYFVTCDKCKFINKTHSESTETNKCVRCNTVVKTTETNFFVNIPIEKQIIKSVKENWAYIVKFFASAEENPASYSDAHDGSILRDVLKQYSDSDINILSLCLNVDGANKYKSNMLSVWPIQLIQNFLPPQIRFLPNNIIVAGLYYHANKPNCYDYLLPLIDELKHLKNHNIETNIEMEDYKFKPLITHCGVDLPAKSLLQQTKQYGGYDACTYCENPGELIVIEKLKNSKKSNKKTNSNQDNKENKFVRYVESDTTYKLRDEVKTLENMLAASKSTKKESIDGVKDVSCLVGLEHFNILFSFGPEYMHACLLGGTKRLFNYFCNPSFSGKPFYLPPKIRKLLSNRICAIKPTSDIVRKPRSLDQRKNYKASEFRSMLLYYLPVCLIGLVPNVYVEHVRNLSAAVYTLLKANISIEELNSTEESLNKFVKQHQDLFGKSGMVMVIHLLKHLCESVRRLGPIWCHSAFGFERNNGCLLKFVNGTTDVLHQISSKYALTKSLSKKDEIANAATENQIFRGKSVEFKEKSLKVLCMDTLKTLDFSNVTLSVHKRIKFGNVMYTSLLYTRPKKSIDYFIGLKDETVGKAKFYFESNNKIYVVMELYDIVDNIKHIAKVQKTDTNILAPIETIEKKYIYMTVGIHQYIVSPPNPYENE